MSLFKYKTKKGVLWGFRINKPGLKMSQKVGKSKSEARAAQDRILDDYNKGVLRLPREITFDEFAKEFVFKVLELDPDVLTDLKMRRTIMPAKGKRHQVDIVTKINNIRKYLGHYLLNRLDSHAVETFRALRRKDKVNKHKDPKKNKQISSRAVKVELALLKRMLKTAKRWKYIYDIPDDESFRLRVTDMREGKVMTEAQFRNFFNALPTYHRMFFMFLFILGKRCGEILGLVRDVKMIDDIKNISYIDRKKNTLVVTRDSDTKKPSETPICELANIILEEIPHKSDIYIFGGDNGGMLSTTSKAFRKACKKVGMEDFRRNDLRHTIRSWFDELREGTKTAEAYSGRFSGPMDLWYAHTGQELMKKAGESMQNKVLGALGFDLMGFREWLKTIDANVGNAAVEQNQIDSNLTVNRNQQGDKSEFLSHF